MSKPPLDATKGIKDKSAASRDRHPATLPQISRDEMDRLIAESSKDDWNASNDRNVFEPLKH